MSSFGDVGGATVTVVVMYKGDWNDECCGRRAREKRERGAE
jgi:hypothetical protein